MPNELTHRQMVEVLEHIREHGPTLGDRASGICRMVEATAQFALGYDAKLPASVIRAFCEWPEYSGNYWYPVPPLGSDDPDETAAGMYNRIKDVWDRGTAYGQARWRLLDFLIEWYRERAEEEAKIPPYPLEGSDDKPTSDGVL